MTSWRLPTWGQVHKSGYPADDAREEADREFWTLVAKEKIKAGKPIPEAFFENAITTAEALDYLQKFGVELGPLARR